MSQQRGSPSRGSSQAGTSNKKVWDNIHYKDDSKVLLNAPLNPQRPGNLGSFLLHTSCLVPVPEPLRVGQVALRLDSYCLVLSACAVPIRAPRFRKRPG